MCGPGRPDLVFGGCQHRCSLCAPLVARIIGVLGGALNFSIYVNETYIPVVLPLMANTTRSRYRGVINSYRIPTFGGLSLRELGTLQLQRYFSHMASSPLSHESKDKIRHVLSSVLGSAVHYQLRQEPDGGCAASSGHDRQEGQEAEHHLRTVRRTCKSDTGTLRHHGVCCGVPGPACQRTDRVALERRGIR